MRILVCLLLAAGAFAAPFSVHKQTEHCPRTSRFKAGKQFIYNYEAETVSGIIGASSARSALKITARVSILSVGRCQHVMKLDSVELWEAQSKKPLSYKVSEGQTALAEELQAQDLHFRTSSGTIIHLMPNEVETTQALNIKRGILSALQAQIVRKSAVLDEVDVAGRCRVNYTVHSSFDITGRAKRVSKTRNLTECSDRSKTNMGFHGYLYPSKQAFSLLKSTGNCQYILNAKNRIQKVRCVEKHLFRPFSAGHKNDSGAVTTTIQSLSLLNIIKFETPSKTTPGRRLVSLLFEHPDVSSTSKQKEEVEKSFISLVRESAKETKPKSAHLFARVIHRLRALDPEATEHIWSRMFDCDKNGICRPEEKEKFHEFLFDALPHCGSEGCAKVMSTAINRNQVSLERGNMFLVGLGLLSVPTQRMVGHVLELCKNKPSRIAMLTLGTIIHKFCEKEPSQCKSVRGTELEKALWWLEQQIGERCDAKTPEKFDHILMALKAIGNAGGPSTALNKLIDCSVNDNVPLNVSVAALEALRRFPCSNIRTKKLLTVYEQHSLDIETRIAAYLSLLKCPSPEVFQRIAEILSHEKSKQVGSFVWSQLTNAMESTEPLYGKPLADMIKKALNGTKLREINLSRLRFSRAYEGSAYSELLDAGGSAQGHLIFHPNSYFPRSAMLNLTVDILGVSTNILETTGRFEGFEILVEQLFGPEGLYPDKKIMSMFNLKSHEEQENEETELINNVPTIGRRSIREDIKNVENNLNKLHETMDIRKHNPSGSLSLKVFGNEMRLASFDDIKWVQTEADNVNMVDYLIKLARGGKKTFSKSFMFLDVDTTVPTILGLPLKLEAKGTTVARLELNGKFDIRNMFWGPMNFDVRGYIKPSAVVEINGKMGVDCKFAESGIMLNSSLYTSTEINGNATYKQGEDLRFELGVPQKPVQIINITSNLYTSLNDKLQKIEGTAQRVSPSPCVNATRVLGIAVCGRMSLPIGLRDFESPFFPLSGPATLSLVLTPTDRKLTKYQLLARRIHTKDENEFEFVSRLSTPGATWEREFEANGTLWLKKEDKYLSVSTGALGYKFGKLEGRYNNVSHAVNVTFSSHDVVYGHPIILNAQYFNQTEGPKRELGFKWSATYKNYTLSQVHKVYNRSGIYGAFTNTTYWPMKHLIAEAELSIPKKYVLFNANHTCTKTSIKFHGHLGKKHNRLFFNFTNRPTKVGILINGMHLRSKNEATMRINIQPWNQRFTIHGSYVKIGQEKGVYFKASHDNKKRDFSWYTGIVNRTTEKTLKTNATVLGRRIQAAWTYFNLTNEKGVKFSGVALGKAMEAAWSYLKIGEQRSLKFNATGLNRTAHAAFSFLNFANEKALLFNATALNKTIRAIWSYAKLQNERLVKFNITALNRTVETRWSFIHYSNELALKFNATVLNKSVIAMWSYNHHKHRHHHHHHRHHHIKFNVTALGRNAEMMWVYDDMHHTRLLKFNATALNRSLETILDYNKNHNVRTVNFNATLLNKTVSANWNLANLANEKKLKLNVTGANKTLLATWSFVNLANLKAIKFNVTTCNKSIIASWSFFNSTTEKAVKFEGKALNKTIAATISFVNLTDQKAIRLNGSAFNKSIEAMWTYDHRRHHHKHPHSHHHLKFNATVLGKKADMILAYDKTKRERSIRFNITGFNKTFELASKMNLLHKDKKLSLLAGFQNYSVALEGDFFNSSNRKIGCVKTKYLNRVYGTSCISLVNTTMQKSLALNVSAINQSMEIKSQLYITKSEYNNRFTVHYNKLKRWESWVNLFHTNELKVLRLNATVARKSFSAAWFYENRTHEKAIGFNVTDFSKQAGVKGLWYNSKSFKEARLDMTWNKAMVSTLSTILFSNKHKMALTLKARVLNWAVEQKGEHILLENGRRRDFHLIHWLRNGSKMLFSNHHSVTYRNAGSNKNLIYNLNTRVMQRKYSYGWEATYRNNSNRVVSHHEMKLALMYSVNRRVSLTTVVHNDTNEMSSRFIVEYLPSKTMVHSLMWEKQRKMITLTWEALPKIPIVYRVHWTDTKGFSITSELAAFNKRMINYLRYFKESGHFDGQIEIFPKYPVKFNGMYLRENGLDFLVQIHAFKKTWNQKILIDKKRKRLYLSVELIPKAPAILEATYDLSDGLKVTTELSAFKRSIQWEALYQKVSKSFTSELTFLNQRIFFLERLDLARKSVVLQLNLMNRTVGFIGRFDWRNFAAGAHAQFQKNLIGWSLILNKDARNVIFNVTLSPRLSGQIAAEMPTDNRLQVTLQRKFGLNIVNESRLTYEFEPTMSRVMFSYNTTALDKLVALVNSTKMRLINMTMKYYNMTQLRARNLTREIKVILKKLEEKIKPHSVKLYRQVKSFNYTGLMKNASVLAKNITLKVLNMSRNVFNLTTKNFPVLIRNITSMYRRLRVELARKIPLITKNVILHLKNVTLQLRNITLQLRNVSFVVISHVRNVSSDLKVWVKNVSSMVGGINIRNRQLSDVFSVLVHNISIHYNRMASRVERLTKKLEHLRQELKKNITLHLKNLTSRLQQTYKRVYQNVSVQMKMVYKTVTLEMKRAYLKLREVEIRKQKVGPMLDKAILLVRNFTCNFNASCTLRNLTKHVHNLALKVRGFTILNKTLEQHVIFIHQKALNLTRNITVVVPQVLRNYTIKVIYIIRNFTKDIKNISYHVSIKVKEIVRPWSIKVLRITSPLASHVINVTISAYNKAYPHIKKGVVAVSKIVKDLQTKVSTQVTPMLKPLTPLAYNLMYQVRNITVRRILLGHVMDKLLLSATEILRNLNHTVTTNLTVALKFIKETSLKSPEEIVDITVHKTKQLLSYTRALLNKTVEYSRNMTKGAILSLNKTLTSLPADKLVKKYIVMFQNFTRNVSAEVVNITRQLRRLEIIKLLKKAWTEIDIANRVKALKLEARWQKVVATVKSLKNIDIKNHLMLVKYHVANISRHILRALNFTRRLIRREITREDLLKKLMAICNDTKRVAMKYFHQAKNLSINIYNRSLSMARIYSNMTLDKTMEIYGQIRKHGLAFYREHEEGTLKVYGFYKDLTTELYRDMEGRLMYHARKSVRKINETVHRYIREIRKYENMTYKQLAQRTMNVTVKVFNLTRDFGIGLYKNYSLKIMRLYNHTRNLTLVAYNQTLVMLNRTQMLALKYYNHSRVMAVVYFNASRTAALKYYNRSRLMAIRYYNVSRLVVIKYYNQTLQRAMTCYNMSRNYTIQLYLRARNISLHTYNVTRNYTMKGIQYLNKTVIPKVMEGYGKSKLLIGEAINKSIQMTKSGIQKVKVWYAENKEKTIEELYLEAYVFANTSVYNAVGRLNLRSEEFKLRLKEFKMKFMEMKENLMRRFSLKVKMWNSTILKNLKIWNTTVISITKEMVSVYSQAVEVSTIAGRQLVVVLRPTFTILKNRTVACLVKVKNITLPLIEKARNFTLLQLEKAKNYSVAVYKNITNNPKLKEFVAKYEMRQKVNRSVEYAKKMYQRAVKFFVELRPKIEAKINETIHFVNVTLPKLVKQKMAVYREKLLELRQKCQTKFLELKEKCLERYEDLKEKYQEIAANPKAYADKMYRKIYGLTIGKIAVAIVDTPIQQIIKHKIWSELVEEIKRHEFSSLSRELATYSQARLAVVYNRALNATERVVLKVKEFLRKANETMHEKLGEFKQKYGDLRQKLRRVRHMKLREVVEHEYVFKTLALAKNMTAQAKNYTLLARNMTLKWIAVGKQYYKNLTILIKGHYKNITLLVKGHYKNVTMLVKDHYKNLTILAKGNYKNLTILAKGHYKNLTILVKGHYKNLTILVKGHYKNLTVIIRNYTLIAKEFYRNVTLLARNYTLQARNITLRYWNKTLTWSQMKLNASKIFVNKTLEKGVTIYRENVVPYYKKEIRPVVDKLLLSYRNYSRLIIEIARNLPGRVMNYTIYSRPYLLMKDGLVLLRRSTKLSIRESIVEARRAFMVAYNHSLNATLRALNFTRHTLNVTVHKLNFTKVYLTAMVNNTFNTTLETTKQYLPLLAAVKEEVFETALFLNQYYSIGEGMRRKVMEKVELYGPRLVNKVSNRSMSLLNSTIRFVNRTVSRLNATFVKVYNQYCQKFYQMAEKYNRTFTEMKMKYTLKAKQMMKEYNQTYIEMVQDYNTRYLVFVEMAKDIWNNATIKLRNVSFELKKLRQALPRYVQIKKGSIVLVIPHPVVIEGNIKTLSLTAVQKVRSLPRHVVNITRRAVNMTKAWSLKMVNRTKILYATVINKTREAYVRVLNQSKVIYAQALNKTVKLYGLALNRTRRLYSLALNRTRIAYTQVYPRAHNLMMKVYNSSKKCPFLQDVSNVTVHYFNITKNLIKKFNFTIMLNYTRNYTRMYLPVAINITRMYAEAGYNMSRNFTVKMKEMVWNATLDIVNSTNWKMAYQRAQELSWRLRNETMKFYNQLRKQYVAKFYELNRRSLEMINGVLYHKTTLKYMKLTQEYYDHSFRLLQGRMIQLSHTHRQLRHRFHHTFNKVTRFLNPFTWVPPFESTAMIFGRPHVFTFDGTYFKFPGYEKPECTYVLARDVLNNKFTLLSQENAIILVTEDANVKIYDDGKVESITKVARDGSKTRPGYNSELPIETEKTTVVRDSTYVTLWNELGIEIRCNVKRNLCTFNIAKWYHGRMMGLLGTNNNEDHDEMMKNNNKPAKNIYDFVNSWEITKDPQCRVTSFTAKKRSCYTKYMHRCRQIFKDKTSPFARFFKTLNPSPFLKACEYDYSDCENRSPKDLKHCNSSAAYVEALRIHGEFVNFLPECTGCHHKVGHTWFTGGSKLVDVVLLVSEGPTMRGFSTKLPKFVQHMNEHLGKYSFRFGLVGFGGKGIHEKPHMVTMNGKIFGKAEDVQSGLKHLKFDETNENGTSDGSSAALFALRKYNFRAGATKIFVLLTSTERRPLSFSSNWFTSKMLEKYDVTLNVFGKYKKFQSHLIGMDYQGRIYSRKVTTGINQGVDLPEGDYMSLVRDTRGSVFGLNFLSSDDERKFRAVQRASENVWNEQIKRDQAICKECVCLSTRNGQGVTYCRNNPYHKC